MIRFGVMSDPILDQSKAKAPLLEQFGKIAAWMLTVVFGVLFLVGYQRVYGYYTTFHVPLWMLDVPTYMYPITSETLVVLTCILVILAVPFVILIDRWSTQAYNRWRSRDKGDIPGPARDSITIETLIILTAAIVIGMSVSAFKDGQSRAEAEILTDSHTTKLVFKTDKSPEARDDQLLRANDAGTLRLVTQTKDLVIVFEKTRDQKLNTYFVARSELSSVRISDTNWHP